MPKAKYYKYLILGIVIVILLTAELTADTIQFDSHHSTHLDKNVPLHAH